ncbi:High mobility group [Trebouxia sp. C0009 RCD-2024]
MMQPDMLRRARVYDSHTRRWALITPGQDWEDGEVSSPVELEQCDEETLADILGAETRLLMARRKGPTPASPLSGKLTALQQQAEAAASSKKAASTSGPAARRGRKANASDEQTGDSTRTAKRAKKQEQWHVPTATNFTERMLYLAGLGPVLVPLSSVIAGASGVLPPHITAALQSLGPGGSAAPHFANTVPSAPVLPAPTAGQLLQQAAVNQVLQQQAAAASAPNLPSAQARAAAASTAGKARLGGGYPGVGPTSLAALVPHVPSPPHVAGSLAAAVAAAAAAAAKSEAPTASAVMAPSSPQTHTQAAGSLVEAATSGEGQEGKGEGKKEKRMRRKKDPAAPKKALTGYLVFINSKREQVIREHPEADLKDQVRLLAALWRQVKPEEKEACEATAAQDRDRYALEKAKYVETLKQEPPAVPPPVAAPAPSPPPPVPAAAPAVVPQISPPASLGKGRKDTDAPKRPRTAYILFSMEFRKTLDSSIGFNDGTKLAAEAWNKASKEEKAPHVLAAEREKVQYERLCDEYAMRKEAASAAGAADMARHVGGAEAGQPQAAEPSSAADGAQGHVAPPATVQYTGPDEHILHELDLVKAKACLARAGFHQTVYYMLVDVWRSGSDRLPDAIRSYKTHVATRKAKPDWKGFVIGIFGLDLLAPLLNKKPAASEAEANAPPAADPDENSD